MNCRISSRYMAGVLFTLFSLTGIFGALHAQPRMMSPKDRASNLRERLNLNDSQTNAITRLFEESQEQMRKALDSTKDDRQSMRDLRMAIMKKTDERIDSLLTADQKKKYEEMKKDRRSRMPRRPRNE
jgi:Spy/CpxP family protein refolding chaperone